MSRARIKEVSNIDVRIEKIKDRELHKIAYMYFIQHISQLEISFELNYCEKTIQRRIKEIRTRYLA